MLEKFKRELASLHRENTISLCREAIEQKIDPLKIINEGLTPAMSDIGEKFRTGEAFLPELIQSAQIFEEAMNILAPAIKKTGKKTEIKGAIIIGTVKGDIHNLGKDIVAMLFKISGYEVRDLGVDVANSKFLEEAEKHQADIIALSSLLTSTMPIQKDLIKILKEKGIRDRYRVIIGGGPVTKEWAENIGADGYAENAMEALTLVNNLMEEKPC